MDIQHGNKSITTQKNTLLLQSELKSAKNIEAFVRENVNNLHIKTVAEYLNELLVTYNLDKCDVAKRGGFVGNYTYQIFNGKKSASRDKLLQIALGFPLTTEETQQLLRLGGYRELYVRDNRDAYLLFAIEKKYNIQQTNELLYANKQNLLD